MSVEKYLGKFVHIVSKYPVKVIVRGSSFGEMLMPHYYGYVLVAVEPDVLWAQWVTRYNSNMECDLTVFGDVISLLNCSRIKPKLCKSEDEAREYLERASTGARPDYAYIHLTSELKRIQYTRLSISETMVAEIVDLKVRL